MRRIKNPTRIRRLRFRLASGASSAACVVQLRAHKKSHRLADHPRKIHHALPARAFAAKAFDAHARAFMQQLHALLGFHRLRVVALRRIPHRKNRDLLTVAHFLNPKITAAPTNRGNISPRRRSLDRHLDIKRLAFRRTPLEMHRPRRARRDLSPDAFGRIHGHACDADEKDQRRYFHEMWPAYMCLRPTLTPTDKSTARDTGGSTVGSPRDRR